MYQLKDLQGEGVKEQSRFKNIKEDLNDLAKYHNQDFAGVDDDNKSYKDIYEFLATLKNDNERLNWLLDYGQFELQKIDK